MPEWWIVGQDEDLDFDWDMEEVYRYVVMVDAVLRFRPSASSSYRRKTIKGIGGIKGIMNEALIWDRIPKESVNGVDLGDSFEQWH
ncbi:hypothetical protein ACLOJK_036610 [Asimina triloba]